LPGDGIKVGFLDVATPIFKPASVPPPTAPAGVAATCN
jgi:hypothetical protein